MKKLISIITHNKIILLALISGAICACSSEGSEKANGYIEGRYTYMSSSVSGVLKSLLVTRGQRVTAGQTLFVLEKQPESDVYEAALENLKQAVEARNATAANLTFAEKTLTRYKLLVPKQAIQQSALDEARSRYDAISAQLAQANAMIASTQSALAQSKWAVEQKTLVAPIDGFVFDTYYRLGENTEKNKPILSILSPADIKAVFYISEGYLGSIKLNDRVEVSFNGSQHSYKGKISFISPSAEYTPPVIYSTETNLKLVYRIEAEFPAQEALSLHPGQAITVRYFPNERTEHTRR